MYIIFSYRIIFVIMWHNNKKNNIILFKTTVLSFMITFV